MTIHKKGRTPATRVDSKNGVRRVVLTSGPQLHPLSLAQNASKNYYCNSFDMNGFQIQIDLQALPANVTIDQIQPNQVWWVEKRTSLYRLYLYGGVMDPVTRKINSTEPLVPSISTSLNNVTISGNLTISGSISGGSTDASSLRGINISTLSPGNGQVLQYNAAQNQYIPATVSGGGSSTTILDSARGTLPPQYWGPSGTNGPSYQTFDPIMAVSLYNVVQGSTGQTPSLLVSPNIWWNAIYLPSGISPSMIYYAITATGTSTAKLYMALYNSVSQIGYTPALSAGPVGMASGTMTATSAGSLTSISGGTYWVAVVASGTGTFPQLFGNAEYSFPSNIMGPALSTSSKLTVPAEYITATTLSGKLPTSMTSVTTGLSSSAGSYFWFGVS